MAEFTFGRGDAIGTTKQEAELHDVGRVGHGVGGAFLDGAEKEAAVFGVGENENRRMCGLGVDVIKKPEADLFGFFRRMAQVDQNHVGPREQFLELIRASVAVDSQGETIAERTSDRFTQTGIMTEEGNLEKFFVHATISEQSCSWLIARGAAFRKNQKSLYCKESCST